VVWLKTKVWGFSKNFGLEFFLMLKNALESLEGLPRPSRPAGKGSGPLARLNGLEGAWKTFQTFLVFQL